LIGADFSGARLQNANFRNANLSHARFDGADLADAHFAGAKLNGADLSGARNLSFAQIEAAGGDAKTLLPHQLVAPPAWHNGVVVGTLIPVSAYAAQDDFPSVLRSRKPPEGDPFADRFGRALHGLSRPRLDAVAQVRHAVESVPRPAGLAHRVGGLFSGLQDVGVIATAGIASFIVVFGFGSLLALRARERSPLPVMTETPSEPERDVALSAPAPSLALSTKTPDRPAGELVRLAFADRAEDAPGVTERSIDAPVVGDAAQSFIESYAGQPAAARSVNDPRTDLSKPARLAKAPAIELQAQQVPGTPTSVVDYFRTPSKSSDWIEVFIKDYYLSEEALDEADLRRIYSPKVDYFGERKTNLVEVAREKARYYRDWPTRHYELVPGSIDIEWKSADVANVTFLYDFKVSAPDKMTSEGRGRGHLTLDLRGPTGRIVREDGEVIEHK
jgi:hypothetical protein